MTRRHTTESFVAAARAKLGDVCDYSGFVYPANGKMKAEFVCKRHGVFMQTPNGHMNGSGCPRCGRQRGDLSGLELGHFRGSGVPLTAERLRELVHYDPETGVFTRRVKTAACVEVGDVCGSLNGKGYLAFSVDGKSYRNNRLAILWMTGEWPLGEVDHKDGVKANNRYDNLRDVNHFVNMQNKRRAHRNGSTGLLGAHAAPRGKFRSEVRINGAREYLGEFDTSEGAHEAYMARKRAAPECVL